MLHNRVGHLGKVAGITLWLCLTGLSVHVVSAEDDRLKAAYLFQLSRFVHWPEYEPQLAFFSLCLYKSEALEPILSEAQGRKVLGRPFRVMLIESLAEIDQCQILFARHLDGKARNQIISLVGNKPVLLSSDAIGFAKAGGTLELTGIQDRNVKIAINKETAERTGLEISANLLELAETIYPQTPTSPTPAESVQGEQE